MEDKKGEDLEEEEEGTEPKEKVQDEELVEGDIGVEGGRGKDKIKYRLHRLCMTPEAGMKKLRQQKKYPHHIQSQSMVLTNKTSHLKDI